MKRRSFFLECLAAIAAPFAYKAMAVSEKPKGLKLRHGRWTASRIPIRTADGKYLYTQETITILGEPQEYQHNLKSEPVAIDFDGRYIPLDQLTFRPKNGWNI